MKKLILILTTILLMSTVCSAQYDPPSGYTTYYHLRMWSEGDRPGADSVNQNLKDIDNILKNQVMHLSGNETISGIKIFQNRVTIIGGTTVSTGNHFENRNDFMTEAPYSNYPPVNNSQLANKYYVDNSISTASAEYMHLSGTEYITGAKTFQATMTTFGDDANGDTYINIAATDNAKLQFNGATFITWDATALIVAGVVDATGYKLNGNTAYLTSGFGTPTAQSVWVSSTNGGSSTKQLSTVDLTINGAKYKVLIEN